MPKQNFTAKEKQLLLQIAREAITSYIETGKVVPVEVTNSKLHAQQGCFVCIKTNGMLRGCIGNFTSDKPLYQLVQEMAISAATNDPRFYPMKREDLPDFDLEISVLSPLQKISSVEEIEVGVHGLYLEKNFSRGVLLPQVATEYGWDRDTFLCQTSLKAGLNPNDWQEDADIYVFCADILN
jgi:AmmeMemoRadiSam system protein A